MSEGMESGSDKSQRRFPTLPAFKIDLRVLAPLAGATMMLFAATFFAWQTWQAYRQARSEELLSAARMRSAKAVAAVVDATSAKVAEALANEAVVTPLRTDASEASRAAAQAAIRAALPDAADVQVMQPGLPEVLSADLRQFGYAKASQLIKAQSAGAAPLQTLPVGKDRRVLTVAAPIRGGEQVLAYAWIELPLDPIRAAFRSTPPDDGRLELRQGDYGGIVLESLGSGAIGELGVFTVDVPGSLFHVVSRPPDAWVVGPDNPWLYAVLSVVGLAFGWLMLWLRKVGLEAGLARLSLRRAEVIDHTPFSEAMKKVPAGKPSTRTAPRASARSAAPPPPAATKPRESKESIAVDRSIFRAYDIRGVVGKQLNVDVAQQIGRAVGSEVVGRGLREVVVGRDGRLSGPDMVTGLIAGLREAGCDVIDIGMVPTPVVYFATYHLNTGSGVAVTGSHNPPDYNGFKIMIGGETLAENAIQALYARIAEANFTEGHGGLQTLDVSADYIDRITSDIQIDRRLKVVVDCGNGVPGAIAPQLLEAIGADVLPLFCDVDGTFPNHHPDPSDLHNLRDLILTVKQVDADIGLAFDGDGDRLGVVTKQGEVIFPDRTLMLFAIDVLTRNPGASIIYDVKCTGHLQPMILKHGGSPIMWKTGHSLIKAKMKETDAELAGEMSGHFFFRERWYGFDDGIYAAARLLEILAGDLDGRTPEEIFAELPKGVSTPELKISMQEGEHYRFIERFKEKASFEGARVTTIDGLRADWPDGWGLVRASNTTPVLVLRFDADNETALLRIQDAYRQQLLSVDPALKLPF